MSINKDNTNVIDTLTHTNNNCNKFRGNPPNINPTYDIADTGATQDCIKLDTPCKNKDNTTQGPGVILSYGSFMQVTRKEELQLSPLL